MDTTAQSVVAGDILLRRGELVAVAGVRYEHPDAVTDTVVLLTDRGEVELSFWERVTVVDGQRDQEG